VAEKKGFVIASSDIPPFFRVPSKTITTKAGILSLSPPFQHRRHGRSPASTRRIILLLLKDLRKKPDILIMDHY
jgi:hypothetical protein